VEENPMNTLLAGLATGFDSMRRSFLLVVM
jgi:hypothetical protein